MCESHVWSWDRGMECYSCYKCLLEVKHRTSKYWNTKCRDFVEINPNKIPT